MFSIYWQLFAVCCLLLNVLAKPQLDEDCELNASDTMHDFCCELHEESPDFTNCQMHWFEKLEPNNEELEQAYMFCTAECAYNATEYLASNRQSLNLRRIQEHLSEELLDAAEQKQLYDIYVKCDKHALALLRHNGVQAIGKHLATHGCHVYPGLVLECVANELILHCPEERFSKAGQCGATREYLLQCIEYLKYKA